MLQGARRFCQQLPYTFHTYFGNSTLVLWAVIEGFNTLTIAYLQNSIGKASNKRSSNLSPVVKCASGISMSLFPPQDCCNRCLFPTKSRMTFLWILSKDYLSLKVVIPFWLWWTSYPNMLHFYHCPTPLLSRK